MRRQRASIAHVVALRVGVFSLIACGAVRRMRGGAGARTLAGCDSAAHSAGIPTSRHTRAHRSLRAATPAPRGQEPSLALPSPLHSTDTTSPGAYRHGRRRSHTGLAG